MVHPLRRWLVTAAWLVPAGILVQAILAGRGWFIDPALFGLHGSLGNALLLIAIAAAVLASAASPSRAVALLAWLTVGGLIGQIGLGYAGRRSGVIEASATHVPLGVALLGLSVAVALLVSLNKETEEEADADPHRVASDVTGRAPDAAPPTRGEGDALDANGSNAGA